MNNKEALKYIKEEIKDCKKNSRTYGVIPINILDFYIEALENQIPQKTNNNDGLGSYCPICNFYITDFDEYKFCPECGQAIDWEVKE